MSEWKDENVLRRLYVDKGLSTRGVAERLNASQSTISKWLNRYGIEVRKPDQDKPAPFGMRGPYEAWRTHDGITKRRVYVHRLLAVAEYGFDAVSGNDVHHKNGIPWDNRPDNIEPIAKSEHGRIHSHEYYGLE